TERAASTIELLELEEEEVETEAPPVETPAPLRAPRVFGPTTPATRRPLEAWELVAGGWVRGPKTPSTARFAPWSLSAAWRSWTAPPREPQRSFWVESRTADGAVTVDAAGRACAAGALAAGAAGAAGADGAAWAAPPVNAVPRTTPPSTAAPPRPRAARCACWVGSWARPGR